MNTRWILLYFVAIVMRANAGQPPLEPWVPYARQIMHAIGADKTDPDLGATYARDALNQIQFDRVGDYTAGYVSRANKDDIIPVDEIKFSDGEGKKRIDARLYRLESPAAAKLGIFHDFTGSSLPSEILIPRLKIASNGIGDLCIAEKVIWYSPNGELNSLERLYFTRGNIFVRLYGLDNAAKLEPVARIIDQAIAKLAPAESGTRTEAAVPKEAATTSVAQAPSSSAQQPALVNRDAIATNPSWWPWAILAAVCIAIGAWWASRKKDDKQR